MIVVDVNVVAYLYLPMRETPRAEGLLRRDGDWAAPVLWRSELRNILTGYVRRKTLTLGQAGEIQAEAEALMAGSEHVVDSRHVLKLANESGCTAYDCEYVAVAMALGVPLVTMDSQLLKAFPRNASPLPD